MSLEKVQEDIGRGNNLIQCFKSPSVEWDIKVPYAVLAVRNRLPFFIVLWLNSCHHWYGLNIKASSCSEEVLWIWGACFHLSSRHILYIWKMVTLFSVCQGNSSGVCTTLVLVTVLLMFLYFLVLPWMCLFYCFLNLDIAFYLNNQKPVHAFSPLHFLWVGVSGHTFPKVCHWSGFLTVMQCINMDLIIWCKFPWYMVILTCPVCIVIMSPFSEFVDAHSIALRVNLVSAEKFLLSMTW